MRRGINIRKRKRIIFNEANKKSLKIIFILVIILFICIAIYFSHIQNILIKKNFEHDNINLSNFNKQIPFSLNKIILFSSATAQTDNINQILSLDLSHYCDIGIYLNNNDRENTIINSLFIDNITISKTEVGTPCLYKKRITDLGKSTFTEDTIIQDTFYFNIIPETSEINYDNYELLDNGSTPISLGFYNKNIKENFMTDSEQILYNGTLLKKALIPQASLNCNISFSLNIITTNDEHYICNVNFDIPFEDEKGSIYDIGYVTKEYTHNQINKFIRVK